MISGAKKGKKVKTPSKKQMKKGSKKQLKREGGEEPKKKREMPKPMRDAQELKAFIKSNHDLKDGVPMVSLVWKIIKSNDNDLDKSKKFVKDNGDKVEKMYQDIAKEQADKRAAKKAN